MAEALEACKMAGITVREGATVETMQIALQTNFEAEELSIREVFDRIDTDGGGSLNRE